jgi:molecular chaperone GrpE
MANDKEDKGFQIPIEDTNEEAAETTANAEEAVEAEPVAEEAAEAAEAEKAAAEAEAAAEADAEAADELPADDPDIVAEAEAVLEEADIDTLEEAQAKAKEWQDRYLRLHAEWDTYRRRMQEQRADEKVRAAEKVMETLLPVLDDFERTVAYAEENGETGLLDGVKAVQSKFVDALTKSGLQIIDPVGEPYDALEAQAVQVVPDTEAFEETVKDVLQKGYKMGKKVLRAAMVTVTAGGPKRPKEESEEE